MEFKLEYFKAYLQAIVFVKIQTFYRVADTKIYMLE